VSPTFSSSNFTRRLGTNNFESTVALEPFETRAAFHLWTAISRNVMPIQKSRALISWPIKKNSEIDLSANQKIHEVTVLRIKGEHKTGAREYIALISIMVWLFRETRADKESPDLKFLQVPRRRGECY
jgi:hypothetical protein